MQQSPVQKSFGRSAWGTTFASLSEANYRLLWITTIFTSAGNWIQQVTLSWLAYEVTGSPVKISLVLGARTLPMLTSPIAGALSDRFDRKRIMVLDHVMMMLVAVGFAIDILVGALQEWHMYAFAFVSGIAWAANNPVRQSLVANSVPRPLLTNAIALNSMAFNSMRMIGPMIGGGLIVLMGPGWNFMIQAIMYVFVLIAILPFRATHGGVQQGSRPPFFGGLAAGFRYISHTPIAASTTLMSFIATFTTMAWLTSQMAVFAAENLNDPDGGSLGLLLTGMGIGGFIGTILVARFSEFPRKGIQSLIGGLGSGAGMLLAAQAPNLWIAIIVLAIQQIFFMTVMTTSNTIIQSTTPDEMRGRVMGVYMLNVGFQPAGGVIAGFVTAATSVPGAWMTGGTACLVAVMSVAVLVPTFRRFRLET